MNYIVSSSSSPLSEGHATIKQSSIDFGVTPAAEETLANPAELFLNALSACILKNVERFSKLLKFQYSKAELTINAARLEKPPRLDEIRYELVIYSQDPHLKVPLLKKNVEKFGTIFNTIKSSCTINGEISIVSE